MRGSPVILAAGCATGQGAMRLGVEVEEEDPGRKASENTALLSYVGQDAEDDGESDEPNDIREQRLTRLGIRRRYDGHLREQEGECHGDDGEGYCEDRDDHENGDGHGSEG